MGMEKARQTRVGVCISYTAEFLAKQKLDGVVSLFLLHEKSFQIHQVMAQVRLQLTYEEGNSKASRWLNLLQNCALPDSHPVLIRILFPFQALMKPEQFRESLYGIINHISMQEEGTCFCSFGASLIMIDEALRALHIYCQTVRYLLVFILHTLDFYNATLFLNLWYNSRPQCFIDISLFLKLFFFFCLVIRS